jgi:RimJ/RimL family protein N-acetyltransferase
MTVAGNIASRRVMERIGMTRRPDLDFHDPAYSAALNPTILYMIERDQWEPPA